MLEDMKTSDSILALRIFKLCNGGKKLSHELKVCVQISCLFLYFCLFSFYSGPGQRDIAFLVCDLLFVHFLFLLDLHNIFC